MRLLFLLLLLACGADMPPADSGPVDAGRVDAGGDASRDGGFDRDAFDGDAAEPAPWRSSLYPADWTPAFRDDAGRFLHDFSYAGYRNGEALPAPAGPTVNVLDHGADPTGTMDSTDAIQAAIDSLPTGGIVELPEGSYRVEGTLSVVVSGVVLRGEGSERSHLWFTSSEGMSSRSHVTFGVGVSHDAGLPLSDDAPVGTTDIVVADVDDLAVGDDVAIGWTITEEFVAEHGMTDTWGPFNGTWQPFFRRTVRAIDASTGTITLDVPLRDDARVRDGAEVRRENGVIREVGVEGVGLSNVVAPDRAWNETQVHALELRGVADAWVQDVRSFASPLSPTAGEGEGAHLASGGIIVRASKRVTIADSVMHRPIHRGQGGNGYLFEVRTSSEILFRDCEATEGRHNFIQNWGFGTSGCVWLRVRSGGGVSVAERGGIRLVGLSEYHHSLATANLVDSSVLDDGWLAANRLLQSSGAGHCATENVFWNTSGEGQLRSSQYAWGYVIGTSPPLEVTSFPWESVGTEPEDFVEGPGRGATLEPASLYEDQLARRLAL